MAYPSAQRIISHKASAQDLMIGLGILLLSLAPFLTDLSPHDIQRVIWVGFMAALGAWGTLIAPKPTATEGLILAAFLLFGAISSTFASSPVHGWIETLSWLAMLIATFVLSKSPLSADRLYLITLFITTASCFYILTFAAGYLAAITEKLPLTADLMVTGFSNIRFYSQFQAWTLPLLTATAALTNQRHTYGLWLAIISLNWMTLFFSGSRGALLSLLLSSVFVAWLFREHTKRYIVTFLISALIGAALFALLLIIATHFGVDTTSLIASTVGRDFGSSSGRTQLWLYSLHMTCEHPWLGAGPMHFACNNPLNNGAHPHNILFQFLAEWGIPFTLLITLGFLFLAYLWIKKVQIASLEDRRVALPIAASLSSALMLSLVDGVAVMPVSQAYGVLMFSLAIAWYRPPQPPATRPPNTKTLSLALPGLFLLAYTIISLPGLSSRQEAELFLGPGHFQPRYWTQGMICLPASTLNEYPIGQPSL